MAFVCPSFPQKHCKRLETISAAVVQCKDCIYCRVVAFKNVEPWTVVDDSPAKFLKMRVLKNNIEIHFKLPHLYTGSLVRKEAV